MTKFDTADLCGEKTDRGYNQATASGKPFWSADPRPEDVRITDIAAQLSRICRFNGAVRDDVEIYTVAQHSVLVSRALPPKFALEGLLHDAAEAYIGDMIKPIKAMHRGRKQHEQRVDAAVRAKFGLPEKMSPEVKEQDYRAVLTERRDIMPYCPDVDWGLQDAKAAPWEETIKPWGVMASRQRFLAEFHMLTAKPYVVPGT